MTDDPIDKAAHGRVGHAVLLGIDNETHRLLVDSLEGRITLRRFGSPEELFIAMEHTGVQTDAMVLGIRLEQPVRIVQRIHGFGLDIPVLVMTESTRDEQLSQALRFAPFATSFPRKSIADYGTSSPAALPR